MDLANETMFNPNASYRDLIGKSELAWDNERTTLEALAKASGIDVDTFEVVGLSTHIASHFFGLSLFIANKAVNTNGKRSIYRVSTDITQKQFQNMLKEYSSNVFLPREKWEKFEYIGEERISNLH